MNIINSDPREVEEDIISKTLSGIKKLPMLELIFSGMSTDLTSALKTSLGLLAEIKGAEVSYVNWGEAMEGLGTFEICAIASADPLKGPLVVSIDPGIFYAAFEMQLSGSAEHVKVPERHPSTIERRVARRVIQVFLDQLSANFNRVTSIRFDVSAIETRQHVSTIQGASAPCVMVETTVRIGTFTGPIRTIIPVSTLDPVHQSLSTMFLGDNFEADQSWRDMLSRRVKGSSVEIQAVMERRRISVADILKWEPGYVLALDNDAQDDLSVTCSGLTILRAQRGHRKDRLAMRVLGDVDDHDTGQMSVGGVT